MKTFLNVASAVVLTATLAAQPMTGQARDDLESGMIQAYDGKTVQISGKVFQLSDKARQQLDQVLEQYPANGLKYLTIEFEPRRKDGKPYIESVYVPMADA